MFIFVCNTKIGKRVDATVTIATNNTFWLVEYIFQSLRGCCTCIFDLICVTSQDHLSYSMLRLTVSFAYETSNPIMIEQHLT